MEIPKDVLNGLQQKPVVTSIAVASQQQIADEASAFEEKVAEPKETFVRSDYATIEITPVIVFPITNYEVFANPELRADLENLVIDENTTANLFNPLANAKNDKVAGFFREVVDPVFTTLNTLRSNPVRFIGSFEDVNVHVVNVISQIVESLRDKFAVSQDTQILRYDIDDSSQVELLFEDFCKVTFEIAQETSVVNAMRVYSANVYITLLSPALISSQNKPRLISQTVNLLRQVNAKNDGINGKVYFSYDPIYLDSESDRSFVSELMSGEFGTFVYGTTGYKLPDDLLPNDKEKLSDVVGGTTMLLFSTDLLQPQAE